MPNYFLVSLSNRYNLDKCIKHGLAGFPSSPNGFWTYLEIEEGDYISFLYGARLWNLYQVQQKMSLLGADKLPPWLPVGTKQEYHFPFRLALKPERAIEEGLVRPEFSYVAGSLLPRSGYRKTHFQADQATLEKVLKMGEGYSGDVELLTLKAISFTPLVSFSKKSDSPPRMYKFRELILQAALKKYLRVQENLERLLSQMGLDRMTTQELEILGELALPEGLVDAVIMQSANLKTQAIVPVEVKLRSASKKDLDQLKQYVDTIGRNRSCPGGALVAEKASPAVTTYAKKLNLHLFAYDLNSLDRTKEYSFDDIFSAFSLNEA